MIEVSAALAKTQIALEAAFRVHDALPRVLHLLGTGVDIASFELAYRDIGRRLRIRGLDEDDADVKGLVRRALSDWEASWMLVLDNADDAELFFGRSGMRLVDYLPFSLRGSILITTRNHDAAVRFDRIHIVAVDAMNADEAEASVAGLRAPGSTRPRLRDTCRFP